MSVLYQLAFLFYILFIVFGALNVITGVFLQKALKCQDLPCLLDTISCCQMFTPSFLGRAENLEVEGRAQGEGIPDGSISMLFLYVFVQFL